MRSLSIRILIAPTLLAFLALSQAPAQPKDAAKDKLPSKDRLPNDDRLTKDGPPTAPDAPGAALSEDDPQVAAYFKSKGWSVYRDNRSGGGGAMVSLTIQGGDLTDEDYAVIARSKTVQWFHPGSSSLSDEGLKKLSGLKQLEGIVITGDEVTDSGLKSIAQCKLLNHVFIIGASKISSDGVKHLATLPKLEELQLVGVDLDVVAFEALAKVRTLKVLKLQHVGGFSDAAAKVVAKYPSLVELEIKTRYGQKTLTGAGIRAIAEGKLPPIFDLDVELIDDATLEALVKKGWLYGPSAPGASKSKKKPATAADVEGLYFGRSAITDKGFRAVLNCVNAKTVFLESTAITDESLKKMTGFKSLNWLSISRTKVTAEGINAIAKLPIQRLSFTDAPVNEALLQAIGKVEAVQDLNLTDAKALKSTWVKHLTGMKNLTKINLLGTGFDDTGVQHLLAMQGLTHVVLNNTALTDTGFTELLKLPNLKSLIVDSTQVSPDVYRATKAANPKIFFYFSNYDRD